MSKNKTNVVASGVFLLFCVAMYTYIIPNYIKLKKNADIGPDMFPKLVVGILAVLAVINLVSALRAMKAAGERWSDTKFNWKQYLPQVGLIASGAVFLILAPILGFVVAAVPFLFFLLMYFGSKRIVLNIVLAIVYPTLLYLLFSKVLHISFPPGIFGF